MKNAKDQHFYSFFGKDKTKDFMKNYFNPYYFKISNGSN